MRFDSYHPAINLIYFIVTIGCTIWFRHPVYALISYVCAFLYSVKLSGLKALIFNIVLVPLAGAYALWYAFYNHFGITALRQNFIGNQITLEALAYGAVQGIVIAACLMWIGCLFVLFTTDKIVCLHPPADDPQGKAVRQTHQHRPAGNWKRDGRWKYPSKAG